MSAQTTAAEDVPTRLQNNSPALISLTNGLVVTSTTPDLSKSMVFTVPLGNYMVYGTVRLPVTTAVGQWVGLIIYHDGDEVFHYGFPTPPPGSDPRLPIAFPVTISTLALNNLTFYVCSAAATVQVTHVHFRMIKI